MEPGSTAELPITLTIKPKQLSVERVISLMKPFCLQNGELVY